MGRGREGGGWGGGKREGGEEEGRKGMGGGREEEKGGRKEERQEYSTFVFVTNLEHNLSLHSRVHTCMSLQLVYQCTLILITIPHLLLG